MVSVAFSSKEFTCQVARLGEPVLSTFVAKWAVLGGVGGAWLFGVCMGFSPTSRWAPFPSLLTSVGTCGGYGTILAAGFMRAPGTKELRGPDV